MKTFEQSLRDTHDWAVNRIHILYDKDEKNANAIQQEFLEWLDHDIEDHEVYSLEFLGDEDG